MSLCVPCGLGKRIGEGRGGYTQATCEEDLGKGFEQLVCSRFLCVIEIGRE